MLYLILFIIYIYLCVLWAKSRVRKHVLRDMKEAVVMGSYISEYRSIGASWRRAQVLFKNGATRSDLKLL